MVELHGHRLWITEVSTRTWGKFKIAHILKGNKLERTPKISEDGPLSCSYYQALIVSLDLQKGLIVKWIRAHSCALKVGIICRWSHTGRTSSPWALLSPARQRSPRGGIEVQFQSRFSELQQRISERQQMPPGGSRAFVSINSAQISSVLCSYLWIPQA